MKATDKENNGIFSKWLITGFEEYCFGSDGNLYKLPYESFKRWKSLRLIKKQKHDRYKINGKWWSQKQLRDKIYLNPNPEQIIKGVEMPF